MVTTNIEVHELGDVVLVFNKEYSNGVREARRVKEVGKLWHTITERLFKLYGAKFGYEKLSEFRVVLNEIRQNIKKSKKNSQHPKVKIEQMDINFGMPRRFSPH